MKRLCSDKSAIGILLLCVWFLFSGCSYHQRRGYSRAIAGYPQPSYKGYNNKQNVVHEQSTSPLDSIVRPWLGTPYAFSGSSKKGTDCSGFVMKIFREYKGIELPHSARQTFKMGKKITKSDLQEGDVIFFGNWVGINHNGIYMGNGRFVHASSSQGVMYEDFNSPYWAPNFKGARRY